MAKLWIAVDWGTSNLRVWVMRGDKVLAGLSSDAGMGGLAPEDFESVLIDLIGEYLPEQGRTDVICCGMVGAAQGWQDAGYTGAPCPPLNPLDMVEVATRDPRLAVRILPGVKQVTPADVMRGEETQIAGLLAKAPDIEGLVCLPGTHSKWVFVRQGAIEGFRTYLTGELFALLTRQSVLRHSTGAGWQSEGFLEGLSTGLEREGGGFADLFSVRADMLIGGRSTDFLTAKLSGLLLGSELAAVRGLWAVDNVQIVGDARLAQHYQQALEYIGATVVLHDASDVTLMGLTQAWNDLSEGKP
ncbi:2-dehydro-3-deoxygalactonokinase [Thalassobius sp. MITS945101]|uniref:2-dehydro-3-deoxygalactonokinase n=1 Tax=Thalassobius sp. MITS945101 TaxID=3096994 RepID=UPI0039996C03